MSGKNRRRYLTETVLSQEFLDWCHDNLENRLEMVVDIESPDGSTIRASDRNKYVGPDFYEALLVFPRIGRTVGEWLAPDIQFSNLTLELSNADGRFNNILPGGANYDSWVGRSIQVKLGLAEEASTYKTIFRGTITDIGGFKRSVKSLTLIARDDYEKLSVTFPNQAFTTTSFPDLDDSMVGKLAPIIYGDWTVTLDPDPAAIPAYIVNLNDPIVSFNSKAFTVNTGTDRLLAVNHRLQNNDKITLTSSTSLPAGLSSGTTYFVINKTANDFQVSLSSGGPAENITSAGTGTHTFVADPSMAPRNVQFRISQNDLLSFDTANVYLLRNELYYAVPVADVVNVGSGNKSFEVKQNTANLWVDGAAYTYKSNDAFYVRVKGKDLGAYSDNPVWQARDLLLTYGSITSGEFDSNWAVYRDKSTPSQSSISSIKSRIWENEAKPLMQYVLSILEQIRLEAFVNRDLNLELNSLHFEDFEAAPDFIVKNWDVVEGSFKPTLDERNNFNRAQGVYDFRPNRNENARRTTILRNDASITAVGRAISKEIAFPNLYVDTDVKNQLTEILRMASAFFEKIQVDCTWRSMLREIGDFVQLNVQIGSSQFTNVPAMIRDIGYDPQGLKIPMQLWSFALCPFPGYVPGFSGTTGGYNAAIVEE